MKQRVLLLTTLLFILAISVMSHQNGPALSANLNLTGVAGGPNTCEGSGCHNGGTYINDSMPPAIYVTDGNNNPANFFYPGNTYIVTLKGTSTAPKWGFQICPSHDTGGVDFPAGWLTGDLPDAQDQFINNYWSITEHAHTLDVVNDTMSIVTYWLAPIMPGVDTVNFYFVILNADGDGTVDGDNSKSYKQPFGHWTPETTMSVNQGFGKEIKAVAYPNPLQDQLNIRLDDFDKGLCFITVFDMNGRPLVWKKHDSRLSRDLRVDASAWPAGTYRLIVQRGNDQNVIPLVKL